MNQRELDCKYLEFRMSGDMTKYLVCKREWITNTGDIIIEKYVSHSDCADCRWYEKDDVSFVGGEKMSGGGGLCQKDLF